MALAPKKTMLTPAPSAATAARRSPSDQHSSWPSESSTLWCDARPRGAGRGDVGDVGDVQAVLFDEAHEGVLAAEEVAGALAVAVGPVERDDPRPRAERVDAARARADPLVEVVAAVGVPGLPGVDVVLHEVGGIRGRVPDRERDVALLATAADELEQVVTLHEGRGELDLRASAPSGRSSPC